ncbi:hypothetical protein M758_12G114100 [Ceratodon purpureus]|nr:hypothetical protein M758_12G114100 [Ceratodon purpureus]
MCQPSFSKLCSVSFPSTPSGAMCRLSNKACNPEKVKSPFLPELNYVPGLLSQDVRLVHALLGQR